MTQSNRGLMARFNRMRKGIDIEDDDLVISDIVQGRWVLQLDALAEETVFSFAATWIERNAPAGAISAGMTVRNWIIRFCTTFTHDLFSTDMLRALWHQIRDAENSSVLKFVMDLTTHFRARVVGSQDEMDLLTAHLSESYRWIHNSNFKIVDGISKDVFAVDEQLFDELPSVEDIETQLSCNTWLIPLLYIKRLSVTQMDYLAKMCYTQTEAKESAPPSGVQA